MDQIRREMKKQKESNKAGLRFFDDFAGHRENQTEFIVRAKEREGGRLCVLGAGNCFDLDLARVTQAFDEVHLVDIDAQALKKARARAPVEGVAKVHLHAPLDISGANKQLESWQTLRVSERELMDFPEQASARVAAALPGPFDVVVSSCLLSQLLLTLRRVLGAGHQLFQAGVMTFLVTHLRLLTRLSSSGGRAVLVSDVSSDEIAPLDAFSSLNGGVDFLGARIDNNQVFHYTNPELLRSLASQDPWLSAQVKMNPAERAWLWNNGPNRRFLVYASLLSRR